MDFINDKFFIIALTFGVYYAAKKLQARTGWVVLNPILVAILALIGILKLTGISYESYSKSASIIDFWLKPAIVALGVPLFLQLKSIGRQLFPLLVSQLAGCVAGIVCGNGQMAGSVKGNHRVAGSEIGYNADCHGSHPIAGRHSVAYCRNSGYRRPVRGGVRIQAPAGGTREEPDSPRPEYGYGLACRRHFESYGVRTEIWRVCQSGADIERAAYRNSLSVGAAPAGNSMIVTYVR